MRRSLLFIPIVAERFLAKAHERGADAIILDLEDAVAPDMKAAARGVLPAVVASLNARGVEVWVRVNRPPPLLIPDLAAAAIKGVTGIMLPKVERYDEITAVDNELARREALADLPLRSFGLCATLETPAGILSAAAIATAPRLKAIALGCEDLAASMGVEPRHSFLRGPARSLAMIAAANGIESWGVAGSIANHTNLTRFERECRLSRALGTTGILCIHPDQVTRAMRVYEASADELSWAEDVVAAYERAKQKGVGSIAVRGQMIDEPIYQRAKRMLSA